MVTEEAQRERWVGSGGGGVKQAVCYKKKREAVAVRFIIKLRLFAGSFLFFS